MVWLSVSASAVFHSFYELCVLYYVSPKLDFERDARYKDSNAIFFDADNDGDLDLCVASGSYDGVAFDDRLFLNDGKGHFTRSAASFPAKNNLATA